MRSTFTQPPFRAAALDHVVAHLSRDPTYVAYALCMNEHGALSFLGRWSPLFRYNPPAQPAVAPAPTK